MSQIPLSTRIVLIVLVLALAALICAGIVLGKRVLVFLRRRDVWDGV